MYRLQNKCNKGFSPPFCLLSSLGPITGQVEFVPSGRISFPVTPGLILMLNYFSFANDVARLQSAHLNMYGGLRGENRFYGDAGPSLSLSAPVIHSITDDPTPGADSGPLSVFVIGCASAWTGQGLAPPESVCVCDCEYVCVCVNSNPSFSRPSFGHYSL